MVEHHNNKFKQKESVDIYAHIHCRSYYSSLRRIGIYLLMIPYYCCTHTEDISKKLLEIEKDWVPHTEGASLYIRPFIIATDPYVGVKPADHYLFMIILSPSGAYYSTGLNPVKIYVEKNYVRAVRGGTGFVKTAANYAISLKGQEEAHEQDYEQVLWLDGVERKYIEEVGRWKNGSSVLDRVYDNTLTSTRKRYTKIANDYIEEHFNPERKIN